MKVGILTVHRAINMGAVLQCYALQETLKSLGHDVWVIDYVQEKVERTDRPQPSREGKRRLLMGLHLRSWFYYDRNARSRRVTYERFDDFLHSCLQLTAPCDADHIPTDFDACVVGSDQLWNSNIFGYAEPVFWGNFSRPAKSILMAYAPSTSVRNLKTYPREWIQKSLSHFDYLSAREKSVSEYLNSEFQQPTEVKTVLDPTLLARPEIWQGIECSKYKGKKYILAYAARAYTGGGEEPVKTIAKKIWSEFGDEYSIIGISLRHDSPIDFIDKIKHASCVVSSSFHGIVFSLIFRRPLFAVKYDDEQDARYVDLLNNIGASQALVNKHSEIRMQEMDYDYIHAQLDSLRKPSEDYLKQLPL